jgi:hypothetical protein
LGGIADKECSEKLGFGGFMTAEITGEELEARFFEIMKQVCLGESFTVLPEGKATAILRPIPGAGRNEETAKVLEELSSPRFAGASAEAICEWLGEPLPRPKELADREDAEVSSATGDGGTHS